MEHWKQISAFVYTVICMFDFIIFPMLFNLQRLHLVDFIQLTKDLSPEHRQQLTEYFTRAYVPLTLNGGGLFHLSFGALLTGAAVATGRNVILDPRSKHRPDQEDVKITANTAKE